MERDDLWKLLLIIGISIFSIFIIGNFLYEEKHYKKYYSYIDLDNNKGIASECFFTDKGYKSGGMGTPICKLEDGTILSVKSYKYHIEKK